VEHVFVPHLMFLALRTAPGLAMAANRSPRVTVVPLSLSLSHLLISALCVCHIVYLGAGENAGRLPLTFVDRSNIAC